MPFLDDNERREFVDLLAELPNIQLVAVRHFLLAGVPKAVAQTIRWSDIPIIDLQAIVDTVDSDSAEQPDGTWPITHVFKNAIRLARATALEGRIKALLERAERRHRPYRAQPQLLVPAPHTFDLDCIRRCANALEQPGKLFAFAVPCHNEHFIRAFCDRLQQIVGRQHLQFSPDLAGFTLYAADAASRPQQCAAKIAQLRRSRNKRDLLCPVRLETEKADEAQAQAQAVWSAVVEGLDAELADRRLICVFFSRASFPLPQNPLPVIALDPPRPGRADVREWVNAVIAYMAWDERHGDAWVERIVAGCETHADLEIRTVYSRLYDAWSLITDSQPPRPEDVLAQII